MTCSCASVLNINKLGNIHWSGAKSIFSLAGRAQFLMSVLEIFFFFFEENYLLADLVCFVFGHVNCTIYITQ